MLFVTYMDLFFSSVYIPLKWCCWLGEVKPSMGKLGLARPWEQLSCPGRPLQKAGRAGGGRTQQAEIIKQSLGSKLTYSLASEEQQEMSERTTESGKSSLQFRKMVTVVDGE